MATMQFMASLSNTSLRPKYASGTQLIDFS